MNRDDGILLLFLMILSALTVNGFAAVATLNDKADTTDFTSITSLSNSAVATQQHFDTVRVIDANTGKICVYSEIALNISIPYQNTKGNPTKTDFLEARVSNITGGGGCNASEIDVTFQLNDWPIELRLRVNRTANHKYSNVRSLTVNYTQKLPWFPNSNTRTVNKTYSATTRDRNNLLVTPHDKFYICSSVQRIALEWDASNPFSKLAASSSSASSSSSNPAPPQLVLHMLVRKLRFFSDAKTTKDILKNLKPMSCDPSSVNIVVPLVVGFVMIGLIVVSVTLYLTFRFCRGNRNSHSGYNI